MGWRGDAVAEVHAPRERGGFAVGVVCEARQEAADAADGDAQAERHGEQVPRTGADSAEALHQFNAEPATQQPADDGFAAAGKGEELLPVEIWARKFFEHAEEPAADKAADGSSGDDRPAALVVEEVATACALALVEGIAADVAECLEERVKLRVEESVQVVESVSKMLQMSSRSIISVVGLKPNFS